MCVTRIFTCVQACTFTHACGSTVKHLQSAHMWTCLGDQITCMELYA